MFKNIEEAAEVVGKLVEKFQSLQEAHEALTNDFTALAADVKHGFEDGKKAVSDLKATFQKKKLMEPTEKAEPKQEGEDLFDELARNIVKR